MQERAAIYPRSVRTSPVCPPGNYLAVGNSSPDCGLKRSASCADAGGDYDQGSTAFDKFNATTLADHEIKHHASLWNLGRPRVWHLANAAGSRSRQDIGRLELGSSGRPRRDVLRKEDGLVR